MDYFNQFLTSSISSFILELTAAIAGSFYLKTTAKTDTISKFLIYFLWFTLLFEIVGSYSPIAYFTNYEYFGFVKNTVFAGNYWWFNIYMLISFSFFIYYFNYFIENNTVKKIVSFLLKLFMVAGVINLAVSDVFFRGYSVFISIAGSLFVLGVIILFFFSLLKSEIIFSLKTFLPIYIATGVLIFNLIVTPSDIYSQYFNSDNDLFVKLSGLILIIANILMYSCFIIGFFICTKKSTKGEEVF